MAKIKTLRSKFKRSRKAVIKPPAQTPGSRPGRPKHRTTSDAGLSVYEFGSERLTAHADTRLDVCRNYFSSTESVWIHVQGHPDAKTMRALAEAYDLHSLAVEDVVNLGQRAKLEVFKNQFFAVFQWPRQIDGHLQMMQVAFFVGPNWCLSFCEGDEDPFAPIRTRLEAQPPGSLRQRSIDYLFYAMVDLVVDHGFVVLESLGGELEELEDRLLESPDANVLEQIHHVKRDLILMRKALWPQREVLGQLLRIEGENELISSQTRPYLRDCHDHAIRVLDFLESYREMAASLHDLYLSSVSMRMNDVMKVLTVIATIFIPLSFLTGLYGMNFNTGISPWNMPELNMYFGYPVFILFLIAVVVGMLMFFRRRKWF